MSYDLYIRQPIWLFFYSWGLVSLLLKYANVGYLLDPYNVCFQAWYVFLCDSTIATDNHYRK